MEDITRPNYVLYAFRFQYAYNAYPTKSRNSIQKVPLLVIRLFYSIIYDVDLQRKRKILRLCSE